jgi:hypothetical protein
MKEKKNLKISLILFKKFWWDESNNIKKNYKY